jgi:hypothetical protein
MAASNTPAPRDANITSLRSHEIKLLCRELGFAASEVSHNHISAAGDTVQITWGADPERQGEHEGLGCWMTDGKPCHGRAVLRVRLRRAARRAA